MLNILLLYPKTRRKHWWYMFLNCLTLKLHCVCVLQFANNASMRK
ncbi:hypothetical protein Goshw_012173 [Gossypium schwendimanii]|uniref:Uncharacterized protein n=1 Tax=Gossypium schwendimanii TaxID=34291 RepID=A0A7J9MYK6_GOSSC|nr:hypothetical protein [Gossypium schwendimanii]